MNVYIKQKGVGFGIHGVKMSFVGVKMLQTLPIKEGITWDFDCKDDSKVKHYKEIGIELQTKVDGSFTYIPFDDTVMFYE